MNDNLDDAHSQQFWPLSQMLGLRALLCQFVLIFSVHMFVRSLVSVLTYSVHFGYHDTCPITGSNHIVCVHAEKLSVSVHLRQRTPMATCHRRAELSMMRSELALVWLRVGDVTLLHAMRQGHGESLLAQ